MTEQNDVENLKIWKSGEKSDPKGVKVDKSGQTGLSVDGYYMMERATKIFGPSGVGWGYDIIEERFDDGKPVMYNDNLVFEKNHTIRMQLWHGKKEQYVTQYGHTKYLYLTAKGDWYCDPEFAKKSTTDAIKKCLSILGVYADVFKGMMKDQNYLIEQKIVQNLEESDNKEEKLKEYIEEVKIEIETRKRIINACTKPMQINGALNLALEKLQAYRGIPGLMEYADKGADVVRKTANKKEAELNKPTEKKK